FFSRRRRHTIFSRDWSSDVCSSDFARRSPAGGGGGRVPPRGLGPPAQGGGDAAGDCGRGPGDRHGHVARARPGRPLGGTAGRGARGGGCGGGTAGEGDCRVRRVVHARTGAGVPGGDRGGRALREDLHRVPSRRGRHGGGGGTDAAGRGGAGGGQGIRRHPDDRGCAHDAAGRRQPAGFFVGRRVGRRGR